VGFLAVATLALILDGSHDDEPLVVELRAVFGGDIETCDAKACTVDLAVVWCDASACHATDRIRNATVEAPRARAAGLVAQLHELGSDAHDPGRVAAWLIRCSSHQNDPTRQELHGHCTVEMKRGDGTLDDALAPIENTKLGGNGWTGLVRVACAADGRACRVDCVDPQPADEWSCRGDTTLTDTRILRVLEDRAGAAAATVSCRHGRDLSGLTSVAACAVGP
jgi:hypothetical protein